MSRRLPLCDGSHADEAWACRADSSARAPYAFVAGPHDENLAERLASELAGVAVHNVTGRLSADEIVVLASAASLDSIDQLLATVDAPRRRVIALDAAEVIATAFPDWRVAKAVGDGVALWRSVLAAVTGRADDVGGRALSTSFLSHAVADESVLLPVVDYLRRHLHADLFVCADSIETGASWHGAIVDELRSRPSFVWLLSHSSAASGFCAFEVGYAMALNKPLTIISLDGTLPPSYVQHLHMVDLPRRLSSRPWLDAGDALTEALIESLLIQS